MSEGEINNGRRKFLTIATTVFGGIGAAFAAVPFISSWSPSARARAEGVPVEVNISQIQPGQQVTVEWRGSPVWILRRTQKMLDSLSADEDQLRDPKSLAEQQPGYAQNRHRSRNPEYLILVGICTHLGCVPKYCPSRSKCPQDLGAGWPGGFFCPCHGSKFDFSGRVFKGVPAPINLKVPPYTFMNENVILIGVDEDSPAEV
ncbi:MAG: ubiquinol-cytochrome c reductase iron-sulfur subunit [Gammaproteobacteria bacterium]